MKKHTHTYYNRCKMKINQAIIRGEQETRAFAVILVTLHIYVQYIELLMYVYNRICCVLYNCGRFNRRDCFRCGYWLESETIIAIGNTYCSFFCLSLNLQNVCSFQYIFEPDCKYKRKKMVDAPDAWIKPKIKMKN